MASPRHGGAVRCLQICLQTLIRRGGAPSGAAGFIANNKRYKHSITRICLIQISWEIIMNNVPGGFAPAPVASPATMPVEIRGNLNIRYSCKIGGSPEPMETIRPITGFLWYAGCRIRPVPLRQAFHPNGTALFLS